MATKNPRLTDILAMIDRGTYVRTPDGDTIARASATAIIARMLDMLDVHPGQKVLEVGTGSGYSTALLAALTGPTGHVASIDVDATLTDRATGLLHANGYHHVTLATGDASTGLPTSLTATGPYDRIVAWTTAAAIPACWITHANNKAVLVIPVELTELALTHAIARLHTTGNTLVGEQITPGGFVPMHGSQVDWTIPPHNVDALDANNGQEVWWISSTWLHQAGPAQAQHVLALLRHHTQSGPPALPSDEDLDDLVAYLYTIRPYSLTTAQLGAAGRYIGATTPTGAALIPLTGDRRCLLAGNSTDAIEALTTWIDLWRRDQRPGFDNLVPTPTKTADGWQIRTALTEPRGSHRPSTPDRSS